jgi:hypothetical protein
MAQGIRPGGLTALAVVNFVFCGLALLGALMLMVFLNMTPPSAEEDAASQEQITLLRENHDAVLVSVALSVGEAVLLLVSGLGYLGQKRVSGRILGSVYALVGLLGVSWQLTYMPFGLEHMTSFLYPLITLVLLNTTFRRDLVA